MKNYTYTLCIVGAATVAYFFPEYWTGINGFQLKELIMPLL